MMKQDNFQYALIPIGFLEIKKPSKYKAFSLKAKILFKLFKKIHFKNLKINTIAVKIETTDKPYIEEVLTQNKIGLNKKSGYKVYLTNDTIYHLCTQEEIYNVITNLNYRRQINVLFN